MRIIPAWTRRIAFVSVLLLAASVIAGLVVSAEPALASPTPTTAWQSGAFSKNIAGIVGESDVVLGAPNTAATQSLALGNGSLGVAEWAANGFTAQLNRDDTFPDRKSPGQVNIPGLSQMTSAADFTGTLDLYNGVLTESGGGLSLKAWVPAGKDELIVDVSGANPAVRQSATVNLWAGRTPTAAASGVIGTLAETWTDSASPGGSGATFGSLAAITAGGQSVSASVVNSQQVAVSFNPNTDGTYRIVVGAPTWTGGNAATTASTLLGSDATASTSSLLATQSTWWNTYWAGSNLMQITSSDGSGQYLENVRTLYLYFEAASMRGTYPASQAGIADLFNFSQDTSAWDAAAYWLYDLRTQISENMSSGNFALNTPIFNLYLNNLTNIESWTNAQMGGTPGACVPETMRYNGNGWYIGGSGNASCSQADSPSYNALNIASGAELALDIWQQYQDTGNSTFLTTYYPLMKQAAIFLLDYQTLGPDGLLHATANAHESQWAVTDPTDDIAAMSTLFPATISAAQTLGTDSALITSLTTAETEIPPYARTDAATKTVLLTPADDAAGTDVIADSYQPAAALHNFENIGLEPVYPYNAIGDNSSLTALATRTYTSRPNGPTTADWSMDAIDAARLDLASQVQSDLVTNTEYSQIYISGLADVVGHVGTEPYLEQSSGVSYALDQALVQDYDGLLRVAPAWPSGWDVSGSVSIQGNAKVDVQVEGGVIETVAIEAGSSQTLHIRNPWAGQSVEVVNGSTGAVVVSATTAATFTIPMSAGSSYLVERTANLTTALPFAQVTGSVATADRHLGAVQIGLDRPTNLAASFDGVAITNDTATNVGNYDGNGSSFSEQALTTAGAAPGATITSGGLTYTWPNVAAGTADNTAADGQDITIGASGSSLGFLLSGSYGPVTGSGVITYTDASTQAYSLTAPDWWSTTAPSGGAVAISGAYLNIQGNAQYTHTTDVFSEKVAINPAKTVASITLPTVGHLASGTPTMHIFAVTVGSPNLAASFDGVAITNDTATNVGNYDGNGSSFSEQALTTAGAAPGATITSGGLTYTWPNVAAGTADNTAADGQDITIGASGSSLGFLLSGSYGPVTGSGVITYTDASTQAYSLTAPDWWSTTAPSGGAVAISGAYLNIQGNAQYTHTTDVFSEKVAINPAKTVASITLPTVGHLASGTPTMHIFALTVG